MTNKQLAEQVTNIDLPPSESEPITNPKIISLESWKEAWINILLSEKRFEYVKTSLLSGLLVLFNMIISARLIFIEASKNSVEWKDFEMWGVKLTLPTAFYIFVVSCIIQFLFIFATKLIEKYFKRE